MFPAQLDGADVLMYTEKGSYGVVEYETGEPYDTICYYAIARYGGDSSYYLLGCNSGFDVISDFQWDSMDGCKNIAAHDHPNVQWYNF